MQSHLARHSTCSCDPSGHSRSERKFESRRGLCNCGCRLLECPVTNRICLFRERVTMSDQLTKIRSILKEHGRLSKDADALDPSADLYQAGMTSHASVNVMLALEGEFDVEFPDHLLKRSVFESIASIRSAIDELTACR